MIFSKNEVCLMAVFAAISPGWGAEASWPDLSSPARAVGGGKADAAVVVGIESYFKVPGVAGAKANAKEWYDYLTETRGIPPQNVKLLTDEDAAKEQILDEAKHAAGQVREGGTLWFVFVGHGAPSADGKDGLLVGVDAQQTAESLQARSVRRGELMKVLAVSKAAAIPIVIDACFSGRDQDGGAIAPGLQPLVNVAPLGATDPRLVVLTAAKGNQFAGALPGASRPAFSYLVLGGLRGWAAAGKKTAVTAGDLWRYASDALDATLRGRKQEPDIIGERSAVIGVSAGEAGPDLAALAKATAGGGSASAGFQVTDLPAVPRAQAPRALDSAVAGGLDFRNVDIGALKKYDAASTLDKDEDAAPEDKARSWRQLADDAPKFAGMAAKRAAQWEAFAAQKRIADTANQKRVEARDADWGKLSELLALGVVPEKDKSAWSGEFLRAYWKSPGIEPAMAKALQAHVPPGAMRDSVKKLALKVPKEEAAASGSESSRAPSGGAMAHGGNPGIQWVRIPGGTFMMGSGNGDAGPAHSVAIKSFQMAKTLVTNKQYQACVDSGACTAPTSCGDRFKGDDQPVVCVDWNQARTFSQWAGGRLPTEAEWEYAARSAGKDWKYPWGNEEPTCARAVISGCAAATAPVCSTPSGNTAQGLCDMAGNAREWVEDLYQEGYVGAPQDGSAWERPGAGVRVDRGGSWYDGPDDAQSTSRNRDDPTLHSGPVDFFGGLAKSALRRRRVRGDHADRIGFRPAR